jgi:aconitate hydratase 2/2-methylisocitrate dehydratase
VAAIKGQLPKPEEYLSIFREKLLPNQDKIYRYLQFDEMGNFTLHYTGAKF